MKLALGTVQFGVDYGIANASGRPNENTVRAILQQAALAGVRVIDTALLYGNSEEVLGRCLPKNHSFDVVTKTAKFTGMDEATLTKAFRTGFNESCDKLSVKNIYGLLAHDANDLIGHNGNALWQEMSSLRANGSVKKIGASVYSGKQIDALLEKYTLDIIQVPLSLLDQRLIRSGQLDRLASDGVEIHARSVFLQGALLMQSQFLPQHLLRLRPYVERVEKQAKERNTSVLSVALNYAANLPQVSAVVCGVEKSEQFAALFSALKDKTPKLTEAEITSCACDDEALIDPSKWLAL